MTGLDPGYRRPGGKKGPHAGGVSTCLPASTALSRRPRGLQSCSVSTLRCDRWLDCSWRSVVVHESQGLCVPDMSAAVFCRRQGSQFVQCCNRVACRCGHQACVLRISLIMNKSASPSRSASAGSVVRSVNAHAVSPASPRHQAHRRRRNSTASSRSKVPRPHDSPLVPRR